MFFNKFWTLIKKYYDGKFDDGGVIFGGILSLQIINLI
jgi:hypothetical protein